MKTNIRRDRVVFTKSFALFSKLVDGFDFSRIENQFERLSLVISKSSLHLLDLFSFVFGQVTRVVSSELGLMNPLWSSLHPLVEHRSAFRFPVFVVHELRGDFATQFDLFFDGRKSGVGLAEETGGGITFLA